MVYSIIFFFLEIIIMRGLNYMTLTRKPLIDIVYLYTINIDYLIFRLVNWISTRIKEYLYVYLPIFEN